MKEFTSIIRWLIVSFTPFILTFGTLRLLLSWNAPSYPEFEYRRISPDRYGFTEEERLEYALASLDYLRRPEPANEAIHLLEELRLPGTDAPFYNDREIDHMLDVKRVADAFRTLMIILGTLAAAGLVLLLARSPTRPDAYKAVMHGGILTTVVVLVAIILIFLAWNFVFTQFHEILFPPDTWTFSYSDSLIRLFPNQFWFDFGLLWTGGILVQGVILTAIGYWLGRAR